MSRDTLKIKEPSLDLVGVVNRLNVYPVKGLSSQSLDMVNLTKGRGFPNDRRWGFALPTSGFDPLNPRPLPKNRFLMRMKNEELARLTTHLDAVSGVFTVKIAGRKELSVNIETEAGRQAAEAYFRDMFDMDPGPRLFKADPHRFTDVSVVSAEMMHAVSLINLDTIEGFASRIGKKLDPERFRGNVIFRGWPEGSELELVGRTIRIGTTETEGVLRTRRCPATQVNPATAERDLDVPKLLQREYGHADLGLYVEVRKGGTIAVGDPICLC